MQHTAPSMGGVENYRSIQYGTKRPPKSGAYILSILDNIKQTYYFIPNILLLNIL